MRTYVLLLITLLTVCLKWCKNVLEFSRDLGMEQSHLRSEWVQNVCKKITKFINLRGH